jgi:hypothetical protein
MEVPSAGRAQRGMVGRSPPGGIVGRVHDSGRGNYSRLMTTPPTAGSRTAAYLVAGALATVPIALILMSVLGVGGAVGGVVVMWAAGIVWLLKRRQEDPTWDRRPTTGQRSQ